MEHITVEGLKVPVVTVDEMREVDRLMVEKYKVQLIQMMENAGRNLAELCRRLLGGSVLGRQLAVAAGKGNNGGGGLAAARHLHNWGARVRVFLQTDVPSGVPGAQLSALRGLPVLIKTGEEAPRELAGGAADLVVSSLVGYSLAGPPRGWVARMIEGINALGSPVVALDLPTGLDPTTGEVYRPCIRATATLTLALPKRGLVQPKAREVVGSLYLADIGVPPDLYRGMGLEAEPIFLHDTIIPLSVH